MPNDVQLCITFKKILYKVDKNMQHSKKKKIMSDEELVFLTNNKGGQTNL